MAICAPASLFVKGLLATLYAKVCWVHNLWTQFDIERSEYTHRHPMIGLLWRTGFSTTFTLLLVHDLIHIDGEMTNSGDTTWPKQIHTIMACFHVISISLISGGDHPCAHYFYVPWLIMTSQWVMMLLGMPHYGTTMGDNVTRDIHYDVTMDNGIAMCT